MAFWIDNQDPLEQLTRVLLPPSKIDLLYWESILTVGLQSSHEARQHLLSHKILRLHIYKQWKHPQHEYVVAEVRTPKNKIIFYCLERSVRPKEGDSEDAGQDSSSVRKGQGGQSTSLDSCHALGLVNKPQSLDTVSLLERLPNDHRTRLTDYREASVQPMVLDLAMLGSTLQEDSPHYKLLQRQCYWFAATFFSVLNLSYDLEGELPTGQNCCEVCQDCERATEAIQEGEQGGNQEVLPHDVEDVRALEKPEKHRVLTGGTYRGIQISQVSRANALRITALFLRRKKDIMEQVRRSKT